MFKRLKIILTVVISLSMLGGIPLPSHQFSPAHQAQAGPLKWAAKKAIGGLVKIAIIKIGTKAGKFALQRLKKIGKDKVKRANIIRHANNYLKKHPKLRNQAIAAFATIGWQLEAGSDLPGLGGIKYSPIKPGPLIDDIANTFRSNTYTKSVTTKDITLYRVISEGGEKNGRYWSRTNPRGSLESTIDLALNPAWGNKATIVLKARIPKNTTIYEGIAAAQGSLVGGGNQIYIPKVPMEWLR